MSEVHLCTGCARRRPIRDEDDRSPCGFHRDMSLVQARAMCLGNDFVAFIPSGRAAFAAGREAMKEEAAEAGKEAAKVGDCHHVAAAIRALPGKEWR